MSGVQREQDIEFLKNLCHFCKRSRYCKRRVYHLYQRKSHYNLYWVPVQREGHLLITLYFILKDFCIPKGPGPKWVGWYFSIPRVWPALKLFNFKILRCQKILASYIHIYSSNIYIRYHTSNISNPAMSKTPIKNDFFDCVDNVRLHLLTNHLNNLS